MFQLRRILTLGLAPLLMHVCYRGRRTRIAIAGGALAGVLQLRGVHGLIFYLGVAALTALIISAKASFRPSEYFHKRSLVAVFVSSAFGRNVLLPYVLLWILFDALSSPYM